MSLTKLGDNLPYHVLQQVQTMARLGGPYMDRQKMFEEYLGPEFWKAEDFYDTVGEMAKTVTEGIDYTDELIALRVDNDELVNQIDSLRDDIGSLEADVLEAHDLTDAVEQELSKLGSNLFSWIQDHKNEENLSQAAIYEIAGIYTKYIDPNYSLPKERIKESYSTNV